MKRNNWVVDDLQGFYGVVVRRVRTAADAPGAEEKVGELLDKYELDDLRGRVQLSNVGDFTVQAHIFMKDEEDYVTGLHALKGKVSPAYPLAVVWDRKEDGAVPTKVTEALHDYVYVFVHEKEKEEG